MNDALNRWSVALPIGLIALGGVMLSGCLVLPGDGDVQGRDPREQVGEGRPVHTGAARADVRATLGDPPLTAEGGSADVYTFSVRVRNIVFDPFCFAHDPFAATDPEYDRRYLVVQYDDDGRVMWTRVFETLDAAERRVGRRFSRDYSFRRQAPDAGGRP